MGLLVEAILGTLLTESQRAGQAESRILLNLKIGGLARHDLSLFQNPHGCPLTKQMNVYFFKKFYIFTGTGEHDTIAISALRKYSRKIRS